MTALLPLPARAQWTVEASAGRAVYDPVSARIDAVNGSLGARYEDAARRWLYLAGGTALGSPGPGWGAGGLGRRFGTGREELSVQVGAHFYGYSASEYDTDGVELREPPGGGITLEAVPTLALRRGIFDLELRAGVVESVIFVSAVSNALTALDGGAVLTASPATGVQVSGIGRFLLLPEGGYPYLGASAQLARGPAAAWAFAGRWVTDLLESPRSAYGAGGSLSLGRATTVTGTWQQEPSDPVYASTPRSTWSLRVSRAFGKRPGPAAAPAPGPSAAAADGLVAIRLPLSAATEPPLVMGDFTEWKPVPMARVGDGWEVRLLIPPGAHRYGFRTAAGVFFLPAGVPRADDGMGGESAVLLVP